MLPVVHGLEEQFGDQIQFTYIDIDDPASAEIKSALGYAHQPEYYLLDGEGNQVGDWSGFVQEDVLAAAFNSVQ